MADNPASSRNPDTALLDRRIDERLKEWLTGPSGGGGDDGTLLRRVILIEQELARLTSTITKIDTGLDGLRGDFSDFKVGFAELKGRVSQLPTLWQMLGMIVTVFGFAFVLIRLGAH